MWLRRKIGHMIVTKTAKTRVVESYYIVTAKRPSRLENSTGVKTFRSKGINETIFPVFRMSKQTKVRYVILKYIYLCYIKLTCRVTFYIKATFLENQS